MSGGGRGGRHGVYARFCARCRHGGHGQLPVLSLSLERQRDFWREKVAEVAGIICFGHV